jgi:hypothetical protein
VTPCGHLINYCCLQDSFLYPENIGSGFLRTSGTSLTEYALHSFSRAVTGELVAGFLFRYLISNLDNLRVIYFKRDRHYFQTGFEF